MEFFRLKTGVKKYCPSKLSYNSKIFSSITSKPIGIAHLFDGKKLLQYNSAIIVGLKLFYAISYFTVNLPRRFFGYNTSQFSNRRVFTN